MSSGPAAPESSGASDPVRRHPALSPGLKQLGYSLAAAIVIACVFYFGFLRRHEGLLQSQQQKFESLESLVSRSDDSTKKNFDALKAERDNLQSENDALVRARQFYEVERDAAQRRAEAAEKDIKDAISMSPYAICGLFCKNHKPGCGGINCRPEWRGPDAQRDT